MRLELLATHLCDLLRDFVRCGEVYINWDPHPALTARRLVIGGHGARLRLVQ